MTSGTPSRGGPGEGSGDGGTAGGPDPDRRPAAWAARVGPAEREAVLRTFVAPAGFLRSVPAKHTKRLVVLDLLAQQFEPGERYTELQVNAALRPFHTDVAALRRYLVENGFLDRAAGWYWRIGGSLDLERAATPPGPSS